MSLRFGSGWLAIYFLICSCTFRCSAPQSRARDYTTFNPSPPLQGRAALTVEVTRPRGRPASRCCVGLFRIPKGLKCVERREAGRGAGVHAPQAEFTFRTYGRQSGNYPASTAGISTAESSSLQPLIGHCLRVSRYLSGETSPEPTSGESTRFLCRQMRTDPDIAWRKRQPAPPTPFSFGLDLLF
jgi:hypothetical protein